VLLYTPEGPRSIDERDVLFVYRGEADGSLYIPATLCLGNGSEITGRCLIAALDALEAKLDDLGSPPLAA
jgi:hypothetical protein